MSTEHLPDPLVPAEVDISKLDGFMLDTRRVLSSELLALSSGDEFKAAVILWCRAWQQRPAASLPNNPAILASFAGVTVQRWNKIKDMALRGFILCNDGRLYHRVLAEDAMRAWDSLLKRHDRTKKATEARKKGRDDDRNDGRQTPAQDARNDERHVQRNDDRNDQRNEVPTVARDRTGQDRTGQELRSKTEESSAGGRPPAGAHEAGRPADGLDDGISAIRQGLADGFERWFDLPDRPISPADGELIADWIAAGAERGLSPTDTAAAVVDEVRRQFRQLAGKDAGAPRSLRAVLDRDVRTAIAHARPARSGMSLLPVPEPYAGHFDAVEWHAWLFVCRITTADGIATVEAPTTMHRDRIAQHLAPRLMAALGVRGVEVTIATGRGRSAA
ncbi:hypothetical protein CRT60_21890 [Azospirillum palustre]|uniref:DUF1376 domain-containing protein n=1 Tax=Azospirillum palustre TaxID=2044885 RepID=A0A2B8B3Q1_9PROT|nr:DUF1376 domain-containing protein [Azospirillum palustre]PGH55904.1 hypothetical protein CRT60_21890 [Azospirillum palustre]